MRSARILPKLLTGILAALSFTAPLSSFAEQQSPELNISPVVIDEKAKPRDILKRQVSIRNTSERKLNLYPSVNDVHPEDGKEQFVSAQGADDRADSLANWIELSRGVVELGPGEERTLPFVIRITQNAEHGSYHARIAFAEGSTRDAAEANPPMGVTAINLEVQEDVKEELQLNKFTTDSIYLAGDDVLFSSNIENIGNKDLQPKGEIRIYNRRGEEVASLEVNSDGRMVSPNQSTQLAAVWSAVDGLGRYKAFLTLDYGKTQTASVQDTIYFWIIPWKQLLALLVGSLTLLVVFALYFHRMFERRHIMHLAAAGLAVPMPMPVVPPSVATGNSTGSGIGARIGNIMGRVAGKFLRRAKPVVGGIKEIAGEVQKGFELDSTTQEKRPKPREREVVAAAVTPVAQAPVYAPSSQAGTIDLKNLRREVATPMTGEGVVSHVINLRKK